MPDTLGLAEVDCVAVAPLLREAPVTVGAGLVMDWEKVGVGQVVGLEEA